jgi:hypothetical protein
MNWQSIMLGVAFAFINFAVVYSSYSCAKYFVLNSRVNAKNKAKILDKILCFIELLFASLIIGRLFGGFHSKTAVVYFLISAIPAMLGAWKGFKIEAKMTLEERRNSKYYTKNERTKKSNDFDFTF